MKLKNIYSLIVLFTFTLFLTGCNHSYIWECPNEPVKEKEFSPVQNQTENEPQETKPTVVRIKFDATPSMQGFVTIPDSQYVRVLDLIDQSIARTFDGKTEYYRFGLKNELLKVSNSQIAKKADFYSGSNPNFLDANFNVALTPLDDDSSDELTIIVTDLYSEILETDDPILKTLETKYLQKNLAVGIVPLKSEFNGMVHDIGEQKQSFRYQTSGNYQKFHPFYLIVLGTYENVEKYFDKLKEESLIREKDKLVIFSNNLVKKPITLNINSNQDEQSLPKEVKREFSLNDSNVVVEVTKLNITELLSISGNSSPLSYTVPYKPATYTLPIKLNIVPDIKKYFDIEKKEFIEVQDENLLEFEQKKITKTELNFTVDTKNITNPGVYTLTYKIVPEEISKPAWWSVWNFEYPSDFDGSKTYNLSPFLNGLRDITIKSQPTLGNLCYGIWKK